MAVGQEVRRGPDEAAAAVGCVLTHQVTFDLLPQHVELGQAQLPAAVRLRGDVKAHP